MLTFKVKWMIIRKSTILQVDLLASRVDIQTAQVDSLKKSMSDFERNVSSQLDIEHKDIVSLAVSIFNRSL